MDCSSYSIGSSFFFVDLKAFFSTTVASYFFYSGFYSSGFTGGIETTGLFSSFGIGLASGFGSSIFG